MSSSVLQFTCTHCQTSLTVPVSMAGIEGPCPKCGQTIQAPQPQPSPAAAPTSYAAEPRERPKTSHSAKIPEPRSKPRAKEELADRPSIAPAPRGLPERPERQKVAVRHSTSDAQPDSEGEELRRSRSYQAPSSSESGSPVSRIIVPVLFAVVSAVTVYFLLYHFMPGGPGQTKREVMVNPPVGNTPSTANTGGGEPARGGTSPMVPAPSPIPDTRDGTRANTPSTPSQPRIEKGDIAAAEDLLRSFFGRRTLDERLAMSEPALAAETLRGGILDGELPPTGELLSGSPKQNLLEDFVDFPFNIDFPVPGSNSDDVRPITILVRTRGGGEPKIVVGPLLDLAGGGLDAFVATPVEGQQTFRAVIEAMPRCFELDVPNADKKFTYKLSSSNRPSEIARSYASKHSPLAEQLYSPDSSIGWGRRIQATIVLEWNTSEDPEQPYIEMREIKALDWSS